MEDKIEKIIKVSDLFIEIYQNFNITNQYEEMKKLSKKELYLLLTLCIDKFSELTLESDKSVRNNFHPFKEEVMNIFNIQDDKETGVEEIIQLIEETGDRYIETDYICDKNGYKLTNPLTIEEVRDKRINLIGK